jgi:elongation factor P--beta-lysine ligase
VIDSECAGFEEYLAKATDFQDVLRQHRHMLMNVCRLSMVENTMVQDCFDRILHSCLRSQLSTFRRHLGEHTRTMNGCVGTYYRVRTQSIQTLVTNRVEFTWYP